MNSKIARFSLTAMLVLGLTLALAMAFASGTLPVAADTNGCPAGDPTNHPTSNLVGAYYTSSGNDATYYFNSFVDRNPTGGIPGLIEYCVYPSSLPDGGVTTVAVGDDTTAWTDPGGNDNFSFNRTNGNPSNIGLDGRMDYEMGTATWSGGVPADQIIVLHINDEAECNSLGQNSQTCFVLPGEQQQVQDLTVEKTADASYTRTFNWTIDKSADTDTVYSAGGGESGAVNFTIEVTKDGGTDSDFVVSGEITVNNPNSFAVTDVAISDSIDNGGDCSVDDASLDVPANGSASTGYTCTFGSNPGSGTNTATATWPEIGSPNTSDDGTDDYAFGDPTTVVHDEIDVTDSNGETFHFADSGSETYSKTYTDQAGTCTTHENTATIDQTGQSASASVDDCQGADLTVSKTATPSYDLKYAWTIDKAVVGSDSATVDQGQPATFNYTISVSHDAGTASNWAVSGTITVSNPNDWQAITADISDSLPGGTCSVTGGTGVSVPASGSVTRNYSCTFGSNPGSGTNTATATWDAAAAHTPNGSASGTAGFDFANATVNAIDDCITVVDDKATPGNTADDVTLGIVCVGDANPKVFNYSLTFTGPAAGTCVDKINTSTFKTNDTNTTGSDSVSVHVCSFKAALTPGYWKNHLAPAGTSGCTGLPSGTSCGGSAPFTNSYLPKSLGGYSVNTILKAAQVFAAMNCSTSGSNQTQNQNAIGCLAAHLLAAKLNVANGANTCINSTIASADALLSSISYNGPSVNYGGISLATRNQAIALKNALDAYNNGVGCH